MPIFTKRSTASRAWVSVKNLLEFVVPLLVQAVITKIAARK